MEVIYISPVTLNDETLQYYNKLLGLKDAVHSGNVDDQKDMATRFKIIVPEAVNSFPVSLQAVVIVWVYDLSAIMNDIPRGIYAFCFYRILYLLNITKKNM